MKPSIPITQSSMPELEEYIEEIKEIWNNKWLTNMGTKHNELEQKLTAFLKVSNISLFTNGHLSLEYTLDAFNLQGEVITTPFTFASSTHAIVRAGLTPVFCDIDFEDYTIQTKQLESLITERTTAIVPVHVYGNICNFEEIDRIAKKYKLKVIYDAAHAFGITVNGKSVGNFGDASIFSFHATKVFHTIEGGAVTYTDPKLKPVLDAYKNFGMTGPETIEYVGGNAKMNEFQAAMGICNLRHIEGEIEKRKILFERYVEHLQDIKGIRISVPMDGINSNFAYFPVLFDGFSLNRNEAHDLLKKHNIFTRKYFYPLTNSFKCYEEKYSSHVTPIAEYIADRVLTLPLYSELTIQEVDKICGILKQKIL